MRRLRDTQGYTLIELLIAVLIIGNLAMIALPAFNQQRAQAKNAAAMTAVRSGVQAASAYYLQSESYVGLTQAELAQSERSLRTAAVSLAATPGAGADPNSLYVASDQAGTPPTATRVILCSISQGDAVFCARGDSGLWTYSRTTLTGQTLAHGAAATFTSDGWRQASGTSGGGGGGGSYTSVTAADSPLHLWRFNETSGNFADAGSGNVPLQAGSSLIYAQPGAISGETNGALGMTPSNTGGAMSANTPSAIFSGTAPYTAEGWIRLTAFPSAQQPIISKANDGMDDGWGLFVTGTGRVTFMRDAIGSQDTAQSASNLALNTWYHVAGVYNGTQLQIYINGVASGAAVPTTSNDMGTWAPNLPLQVGRGWDNSSLNGRVDDVAIYPSALSAARILAHYNCGASGSC